MAYNNILLYIIFAFIFSICILTIGFIITLNTFFNRIKGLENKYGNIEKLLRENVTEGIVGLHNHIESELSNNQKKDK